MKKGNNKGVSMITLIITIVVIVILATISMIATDEPVDKSQRAKKEAEIAQEKQILSISIKDAVNIFSGEVEKETLEELLSEYNAIIDEDYSAEEPTSVEYKVVFKKTGNSYIINELGEITVLDRIYADNNTPNTPDEPDEPDVPDVPDVPDEPETPSGPVGDTVTVAGQSIKLVTELTNITAEKPYGATLGDGTLFYHDGKYYIVVNSMWVAPNGQEAAQLATNAHIINIDKGIIVPGPNIEPGDIKMENGELYVFFVPYNNPQLLWNDPSWWKKVSLEPLVW